MLTFQQCDLFESGCQALVNPVNCVGVMGKGLALVFRRRFPEVYDDYRAAWRAGLLSIGHVHVSPVAPRPDTDAEWVIHFPTKNDWRQPSELAYIARGLADLGRVIVERDFRSVAMPALGCGLGGLPRQPVLDLIAEHLKAIPVSIRVCLDS